MFYAACSYLACLSNYLEMRLGPRSHVVEAKHTVFIIVYGVAATFLPTVYFIDLLFHKKGEPPVLPWWVTQSADVVWMLAVMNLLRFTPPDVALHQTITIASDVEEQKPLTSPNCGGL